MIWLFWAELADAKVRNNWAQSPGAFRVLNLHWLQVILPEKRVKEAKSNELSTLIKLPKPKGWYLQTTAAFNTALYY